MFKGLVTSRQLASSLLRQRMKTKTSILNRPPQYQLTATTTTTGVVISCLTGHSAVRLQSTSKNSAAPTEPTAPAVVDFDYEKISYETLDSLCEFFDEIPEKFPVTDEFDVSLDNGVLTVAVSKSVGTFVINRQSPNRQIWLSSPISGPKRYDYVNKSWLYSADGKYIHELLQEEFSQIFSAPVSMGHVKNCQPDL